MLYTTELSLATEKQKVLDLKAELQNVKDAARVAREATEAVVKASYERGVIDTEAWPAEEVAMVCRDYVFESWRVAMDKAGAPTDLKLRKYEHIFFPKDIQEIPSKLPPPLTLSLPPPEQPLVIQDSSLNAKVGIQTEKGKEV